MLSEATVAISLRNEENMLTATHRMKIQITSIYLLIYTFIICKEISVNTVYEYTVSTVYLYNYLLINFVEV